VADTGVAVMAVVVTAAADITSDVL